MKKRNRVDRFISRLLMFLIKIYQKTLSFDHSWFKDFFPYRGCKFYPTCSQYGYECLEKKGLKSLPLIVKRVGRCHPWSDGGIDEVSDD